MKVGISLTSNHPDAPNPRDGARWMIERAAAARQAALDSLFVGDQHVSPTPYYQNTPILGRLLAEWGAAPSGCLFLLPLWHPVLAAEQIGTLAAIAQGPFVMQCGLGWGEARFAAMGANIRTRPSAFEEALDIVRRKEHEESVSRLAAIVASSDDAIIGKTLDGIVTDWNRRAEQIFVQRLAVRSGRAAKLEHLVVDAAERVHRKQRTARTARTIGGHGGRQCRLTKLSD